VFDSELIPMRVAKIQHLKMEKDDAEFSLIELTLEINPFTPKLATELDDFVRRTLFTQTDAEVTAKLGGAVFRLSPRVQEMVVKAAPDQGKASFSIAEVKIWNVHAKRSQKTSTWRIVFTATFSPASIQQQAAVIDSHLKTRYFTFADAEADLFSEPTEKPKRTRGMSSGASESVPATH